MTMGEKPSEEDWEVCCSDEEKYDPGHKGKGTWQPNAADIKVLYENMAKGERPVLEWKCLYGRRSPTPEREEVSMDTSTLAEEEPKEEEKVAPTAFDFEEFGPAEGSSAITPRRTPGSAKTPRSTKRVARLDKIMDDIRRHKKLNEEGDKTPSKQKSQSGSPGSTPVRPNKGSTSPKKL